jgi:predicted peroxiredoxin
MSEKLLFNCTHGKETPERAILPFIAANIAATAGREAIVVCTVDAVWLGTDGGTAGVNSPGLPALSDLLDEFVSNRGEVWLCGACTKPRGITEDKVITGAKIVGAAKVVEEIINGAKTVAFA